MLRYLDYLSLKYPELVEILAIGKSSLGRPLRVIKISTGQSTKNGEVKPAVWIDGGEFNRLHLLLRCPALGL
jgi:Zinc carboxypeptidase.